MTNYVSFGSSSFLFLLPFLYSVINRTPHNLPVMYWTYTLGLLVCTSFLCNYYATICEFLLCDHSAIITLSIIYFLCFSRMTIACLLGLLSIMELILFRTLSKTVGVAFLSLNLFAFTTFTMTERIIWTIAFLVGIYCKLSRDYTCIITYPIHTTIWHVCCAILLILASRSMMRHTAKTQLIQ